MFLRLFVFVLEVILFGVYVLNFSLKVDKFIFQGTKRILELSDFLPFLALLSCALSNSIVFIVSILFLNTVQLDDHLLLSMILDNESFILQHFL